MPVAAGVALYTWGFMSMFQTSVRSGLSIAAVAATVLLASCATPEPEPVTPPPPPPPAVTLTGIIHHIKERLIIMKIQIVWVPFRKKPQPGRLLIPP